jgi:hypothetical protein
MFKRVVALLLLPTVLLTQWASTGQCHGCGQVPGHDRGPHVHLTGPRERGPARLARGQQEQRPHRCCHHRGDERGGDQDGGNLEGGASVRHDDDSTDHHGGGVVYLPTSLVHGWLNGRSSTGVGNGVDAPALLLGDGVLTHVHPLGCTRHPPAFKALPNCPAYLSILHLLI